MLTNWVANVRKYAPHADEAAIAGIVREHAADLGDPDGGWVALGDPAERHLLRERFLRGELGQLAPDGQLDGAIEVVGRRLQGEARPDRVTVYYLLAEHFGQLGRFAPRAAPDGEVQALDRAPHPSLHSAGATVLGAAGEAAAFFAGAPISGAAEATIQLGDLAAETADAGAARLAGSLSDRHAPAAGPGTSRRRWWLVAGVVVAVAIVWWIALRH